MLTRDLGEFFSVPIVNLIKSCTDDGNSKESVKVVLEWTTAAVGKLMVELVDDSTESDLDDVEDEQCESKALSHGMNEYKQRLSSASRHTVCVSMK